MLKFSKANAKLVKMQENAELSKYLQNKRKIYSLDLLSGWSCPYAKDCLSKAVQTENGLRISDGKDVKFRCFSASQEVLFTAVYKARKHNLDMLRQAAGSKLQMVSIIADALPKNAGIIRIHVAGDFFNKNYFEAWLEVARHNPDKLFYAYTKSLKFWVDNLNNIPNNMVLTASRGGKQDDLIDKHGLRDTVVILREEDAVGPIDSDDSHAANPTLRNQKFSLLIHGPQPAGSEAGKAKRKLKGKGSYARK